MRKAESSNKSTSSERVADQSEKKTDRRKSKMATTENPTQLPPNQSNIESGGNPSRPSELTPGQQVIAKGVQSSAPTTAPPAMAVRGSEAFGVWNDNKRVTGLWGIAENRNSWMHIDGVGWKKLADNSDSASIALSMLAGHARALNRAINYRDEADGKVYEMYVW
jgi:hypothetical protein